MSVGTSKPDLSAESLAKQIGAYNPKQRDAKTVGQARSAVILAFGRALSGAPAPISKALLDIPHVASAGGRSLIFGTERRTSAIDAALINATAAAAGCEAAIDAPNAAFVVALFGLCEERQTTGQAFLDALMFGAEMSGALAPIPSQSGSALFGVVVAAARVLELSPPKIAAALLMAGIVNADSARDAQGEASSLEIGFGQNKGLLAVLLAEAMHEASCAEMVGSETAAVPSETATGNGVPMGAARDLLAVRLPPSADLWDQFEQQASAVLPRDHIGPLFERLETIDKVTDLATVSRLLQGRGTQATPKKVVFALRGTQEPEETNWVP